MIGGSGAHPDMGSVVDDSEWCMWGRMHHVLGLSDCFGFVSGVIDFVAICHGNTFVSSIRRGWFWSRTSS